MSSPHPEVIIEQVGVDGELQVEGGRDKTLSSDSGLTGVAVKCCSSLGNIVSARNTEFGTLPWHPGIRVKFGTYKQNWDFWDYFKTLVPIGRKSQIWDFVKSTAVQSIFIWWRC